MTVKQIGGRLRISRRIATVADVEQLLAAEQGPHRRSVHFSLVQPFVAGDEYRLLLVSNHQTVQIAAAPDLRTIVDRRNLFLPILRQWKNARVA